MDQAPPSFSWRELEGSEAGIHMRTQAPRHTEAPMWEKPTQPIGHPDTSEKGTQPTQTKHNLLLCELQAIPNCLS